MKRAAESLEIPEKTTPSDAVTKTLRDSADLPLQKNPAAQSLGQRGGIRRAETMTPERRSEIARLAAKRRWDKG